MNKLKVELLPQAWEELDVIADYYLKTVGIDSAKKITDKILNSLKRLEDMPFSGSYIRDEYLKLMGYRVIICGDYLCFYRVIGDTVYIYHIANGKTNYLKLFE